jgi:hypothetical protein
MKISLHPVGYRINIPNNGCLKTFFQDAMSGFAEHVIPFSKIRPKKPTRRPSTKVIMRENAQSSREQNARYANVQREAE